MCTTRDVLSSTFWRNSLIHAISHRSSFAIYSVFHCHFFILYNNYNKNFNKNQLKFLNWTERIRTFNLPHRVSGILSGRSAYWATVLREPISRILLRTFSGWVIKGTGDPPLSDSVFYSGILTPLLYSFLRVFSGDSTLLSQDRPDLQFLR